MPYRIRLLCQSTHYQHLSLKTILTETLLVHDLSSMGPWLWFFMSLTRVPIVFDLYYMPLARVQIVLCVPGLSSSCLWFMFYVPVLSSNCLWFMFYVPDLGSICFCIMFYILGLSFNCVFMTFLGTYDKMTVPLLHNQWKSMSLYFDF